MQRIDLDLDKENELIFKLSIEGTKPAKSTSRFLLEGKDYSLVFPASSLSNGEISIVIPALEKVLDEGEYRGILEVIVDDRVFTPIQVDTEFKKSLKVVAETVVRKRHETTVLVSPAVVVKREHVESNSETEDISPKPNINLVTEKTHKNIEPKRPHQRNRVRPDRISREVESKNPKRALTSHALINQISKKYGITLSESQLKEVLRQYSTSKKQRGKK